MAAVEVDGLEVRYGDVVAVDGVSFAAEAGKITAVLGPNGAGKTTTMEVLEGFKRPGAGAVSVLGLDPTHDHAALTTRMGVMLQSGGVGPGVRVLESIVHAAALYDHALDPAELLARVGLTGKERRSWRQISGGEQRRLALALALVGRPQVAFLDEPASGVDPQGRQAIREVVASLRDDGVTVLLTTHDLDEAEKLADHVVILDHGTVVAAGSPADLMRQTTPDEVRFGAPAGLDVGSLGTRIGATVTETTAGEYLVAAAGTPTLVAALTAWLAEQDLPLADLRAGRQRLEDVFLRLTSEAELPPADTGRRRRGRERVKGLLAHLRLEVTLLARNGESLLLMLGIPILILVFFSKVDVLPIEGEPIDFLAPGVLALAVLSSSMVQLAIGTGFEREYGVLKRLGATPLGRPRLLAGKTLAILAVEAVQVVVLSTIALALGWDPDPRWAGFVIAVVLGTVACAGLGLCLAGSLKALTTLAAANGLYLVLLLLSGMVIPLEELPAPVADVAKALPSTALTEAVRGSLTAGATVPGRAWAVLVVWAIVSPLLATRLFRWE